MKPIIRLEPWLTRDYVDRAEKMRSLDLNWDPHIDKLDLVCCWIICIGLVCWIALLW